MNIFTQKTLQQINHTFYSQQAKAFDQSRQQPWAGWYPLLNLLPKDSPLSVLDLGCGNGRFGKFLHDQGYALTYTGVDSSVELLTQAKTVLSPKIETQLIKADASQWLVTQAKPVPSFDLVVAFGLLHHLPGSTNRLNFLSQALKVTESWLAVSLWQFALFPRFKHLIIPWEEFNRKWSNPIQPDQLEPNDFLLSFAGEKIPRYCHSFSNVEIQEIDTVLPYKSTLTYQADGKEYYNRYLVWQPVYHSNKES
jgi:SAM-dependent methyltransferase